MRMRLPETSRLSFRPLDLADAAFMLELVNQPGFLRYIGDRHVHNLDDSRRYLREGPIASYARHGYGMWCIEDRASNERIGICGLVRRPDLEHADLGYALLARFESQGYAVEAGRAVLVHAFERLGLERIAAIVTPDNLRSIRVLDRLGFAYERQIVRAPGSDALCLYAIGRTEPVEGAV